MSRTNPPFSDTYGYGLRTPSGHIVRVTVGQGRPGKRGSPGDRGLPGSKGERGEDGRQVEFRVFDASSQERARIQWRYTTPLPTENPLEAVEPPWNDLVNLSDMRGLRGYPGRTGALRVRGATNSAPPDPEDNEHPLWPWTTGDILISQGRFYVLQEGSNGNVEWTDGGGFNPEEVEARVVANLPLGQRNVVSGPGEDPDGFGDSPVGLETDPDTLVNKAHISVQSPSESTQMGKSLQVTGSQIIASRERVRYYPDHMYSVFFRMRRQNDGSDPLNDAVTVNVAYMDSEYNSIGAQVLRVFEPRESDRNVSWRGLITGLGGLARHAPPTADNLFADALPPIGSREPAEVDVVEPPEATRYITVYAETFGGDAVNLIERVELYEISREQDASRLVYPEDFKFPEWTMARPEENVIHVANGGDDSLEGENRLTAVETLERAIEIANENPDDKFVISVHPGEYVTQGNLDVPDNVTGVFGNHNARSTRIVPDVGAEELSCFRMGNGGYVEGFSFEGGWRTDDLEDPSVGVISFRPGAVIARTVYIHNVTFWRSTPPVLVPPPLDAANGNPLVGPGPLCVLADKGVVSQYSPFPQIMLWGATPTAPNNLGYVAKNGGFINGINAIGLWSHRGFVALNGGEMILTNCASQFGDWSLDADGFRMKTRALSVDPSVLTVEPGAADALEDENNIEAVLDSMWTQMQTLGFGGSEEFTRRDAGFLLEALAGDLRSGQQEGSQIFAEGMFAWDGSFVGNVLNKPFYVAAWENMRDSINGLGISSSAQSMVSTLINDVVIATVEAPSPPQELKPSTITSLFHQWNNAGTGVNGRALRRPPLPVIDTVRERNFGRVVWNGQDDQRRLYLNEQFIINGNTGQAEGPAVDRTIEPRARIAALIAQGQL